MALRYAGISHELREVLLGDKPAEMIQASAKGTVPVLCLPDGTVIDESRDVMVWAVSQHDPENWLPVELLKAAQQLIDSNDDEFKKHLDQYKYWDRYPQQPQEYYRTQAEVFLQLLEGELSRQTFLLGRTVSLADVAIFPFIRQFAFVDKPWFDQAPYPNLQAWLSSWLQSSIFLSVMQKQDPWQSGDCPLLAGCDNALLRKSG